MPFSGNDYTLPAGSLVVNGDVSDASQHNTPLEDIEDALSTVKAEANSALDMDNMVEGTDAKIMTADERTKLAGIEALADVTDATNVTAAGAVMDGDFSSNGLMKRTGAGTYSVITDGSANWDEAYGWGDHAAAGYLESVPDESVTEAKLDADNSPTNGYVLSYVTGTGRMSWVALSGGGDMLASAYDPNAVAGDAFDMDNMVEGTDTKILTADERTKLAGVEANADVTDATNVTAAGAVMDGAFSSNGLMKRTGAGAYTVVTDGSANWDTAYGWGDHAGAGYLTAITGENLGDLADVSSAAPTSGDVLTWDGAQWEPAAPAGGGGGTLLAILEERQTLNTAGGTASVGNNDRVLNTEVYDAGSYASISSGDFTVTEDCWCDFITASYRTAITKAWIYCVTDSAIVDGSETVNVHSASSAPASGVAPSGGCQLESGKTYRVVMSCSTAQTTNGRGVVANAGGYESYTQVHLWSLA